MPFNAQPTSRNFHTKCFAHETFTPPNKLNPFALCQFPAESCRKLGAGHPRRCIATHPNSCHSGDSRLIEYFHVSPRVC